MTFRLASNSWHLLINFRTYAGTLEEAASHVHQAFVKLRPPKKIPTPYGGTIEYLLQNLYFIITMLS